MHAHALAALAGALFAAAAGQAPATTFSLDGVTDATISGGASFAAAPVPAIRSGSPHQHSLVQFATPFSTAGVTVTAVALDYRYSRGYSGALCSNFSVVVAGTAVYTSPALSDFPYSKSKPNYSPPVHVDQTGLSVAVPKTPPSFLEIAFNNNDCNVQLMTPLKINVTCSGGPCAALPLLPTFFDDNMVLQRKSATAIYGYTGVPGDTITVNLKKESTSELRAAAPKSWTAPVNQNGSWAVSMDPQEASTGWTVMVSTGTGAAKRQEVLKNVAFGDVYLCSGQSNMEVRVADVFNASQEIAASGDFPDLRMWTAANTIAHSKQKDIPDIQKDLPAAEDVGPYAKSTWAASAPGAFPKPSGAAEAFGKQDWFSAACYFFGRDVYKSQGGKVPIGLMASDWGGQPIEPFMSPDALADKTCGGTKTSSKPAEDVDVAARSDVNVSRLGETSDPTVLWWGMTEPLAQMKMTGAVWYQGETNYNYPQKYACSFPSMIHDWRQKFGQPELMFLFVQLAPSTQLGNFVGLRAAQMVALELPKVGYAVAVDIGDISSPMGSIHPRRKQEVGRRLSLEARRMAYGESSLVSTGPVMASVAAGTDDPNTLVVKYADGTAHGLHTAPTADCDKIGSKLCCGESPFTVQATNGTWIRAAHAVKDATIVLGPFDAGTVKAPAKVQYAWEQWPQCSLYNGNGGCDDHEGIAATPFCWDGAKSCAV